MKSIAYTESQKKAGGSSETMSKSMKVLFSGESFNFKAFFFDGLIFSYMTLGAAGYWDYLFRNSQFIESYTSGPELNLENAFIFFGIGFVLFLIFLFLNL